MKMTFSGQNPDPYVSYAFLKAGDLAIRMV